MEVEAILGEVGDRTAETGKTVVRSAGDLTLMGLVGAFFSVSDDSIRVIVKLYLCKMRSDVRWKHGRGAL